MFLTDKEKQALANASAIRANNKMKADANTLGSTLGNVAAQQKDNGNFFTNLIGGIGEKISDVGNTASNMFRTAIGLADERVQKQNVKDISANDSAKRNEIAKKYGYIDYATAMNDDNFWAKAGDELKSINSDTKAAQAKNTESRNSALTNVKDIDLNQARGQALSAYGTVVDAMPGLGTVGKVLGNVASGTLEGVGDAFKNASANGTDIDWSEAVARGLAGAGAAGVGGAIGSKLGGAKSITGAIGRGALSGAASGATAGGIMAGMTGQNAIEGALSGATSGAQGGALMGGVNGALSRGADAMSNRMNRNADAGQEMPRTPMLDDTDQDMPNNSIDRQTAKGWGDKNMSGEASNRNNFQKIGNTLQKTGQQTKDSAVYSKLKGNTADEMASKQSIERLRKLGYKPSDYDKAANLSEIVNKWYDDEIQKSGAKITDVQLQDKLMQIASDRNLQPTEAKKFATEVRRVLDTSSVNDEGIMNQYSVGGMEDSAKNFGRMAKKLTTTSEGGSKQFNGTLSAGDASLADAYRDARNLLRGAVNENIQLDDVTKQNLAKVLKDSGANEKAVNYLMDSGDMSTLKSKTSLFEDARTMNRQMNSSPLKRGANSDNSTNIVTQVANASGISGLLNTAVSPVGGLVGSVEKIAGKAISKLGDTVGGRQSATSGNRLFSKIANGASNINNFNGEMAEVPRQLMTIGNRLEAGGIADNIVNNAQNAELTNQAQQSMQNFANQYGLDTLSGLLAGTALNGSQVISDALGNVQAVDTASTPYGATMANASAVTQQSDGTMTQLENQLQTLSNGMQNALNAGDFTSYAKIMDLYNDAYGMYSQLAKAQASSNGSNAKLSDSQRKALTAKQQLETLANSNPTAKSMLSNSAIGGLVGLTGGDPYSSNAKQLETTLTYLLSGASSSDKEKQAIRDSYIPQYTDSEEVRQRKLEAAQQVINSYLEGTSY